MSDGDAHNTFALPDVVQQYLDLLRRQHEVRTALAAVKGAVQSWIKSLPKQSIEIAHGSKLKMTTITRRIVNQDSISASLQSFLLQSNQTMNREQAAAFAHMAAEYIFANRPSVTTNQLQQTHAAKRKCQSIMIE